MNFNYSDIYINDYYNNFYNDVDDIPLGIYIIWLYNFIILIMFTIFYYIIKKIFVKIDNLKCDIEILGNLILNLIKKENNNKDDKDGKNNKDSKDNKDEKNDKDDKDVKDSKDNIESILKKNLTEDVYKIINTLNIINNNDDSYKKIFNNLDSCSDDDKKLYDSYTDDNCQTYVVGTLDKLFD